MRMRYQLLSTLPCLFAFWFSVGPSVRFARADITYHYVGNAFDEFPHAGFGCPPVCNIEGSFTVANPLAADLPLTEIFPLSFSITSGGVTLTDGIPGDTELDVSTDSFGAISTWSWVVVGPDASPTARILTENVPAIVADDLRLASAGALPLPLVGLRVGQVSDNPGTWTITPEPGGFVLFGTVLLAVVGVARRNRSTQ
jgi:hypothetical protein